MDKKSKVGPYLVDIADTIILDHHFHTHLAPGRHADYVSDVPLFCMLDDFVEFLVPVPDSRNMATRFIKTLKPEGTLFCKDSTEIAGKPTRFSLLEVRCSPDHEKPFRHCIAWKFFIVEQCNKLTNVVNGIASKHVPGYGYILTGRLGCSGTQCVIFNFSRPGHIGHPIERFFP